jgi:hypothetical protein
MSLSHVLGDKVSFAGSTNRADIAGNRLRIGADNVHLIT